MKTLENQLEEHKKALQETEVQLMRLQGAVRAMEMAIEERDKPEEETVTEPLPE